MHLLGNFDCANEQTDLWAIAWIKIKKKLCQ